MKPRPTVDKAFSTWLVSRNIEMLQKDRQIYSIAIESPCLVCQPRVAVALALYLNEFDDNEANWLPVTDHRLEQLQAHKELREMLLQGAPHDLETTISFLSNQGGVVLELPKCHLQTAQNPQVFQVSMSCKEPTESNHHLWINAKRIPQESLVVMIANAFFDWSYNGGDRSQKKSSPRKGL